MGTPSVWLALAIGAGVGLVFSIIHAVAAINFNADQTISGTGINLLADGVTIFVAQILFSADRTREFRMGMQTDKLGIYPTAYIALVVVILAWFVLYKLPFGMHLRACGEHPKLPIVSVLTYVNPLHRRLNEWSTSGISRRVYRLNPNNPIHLNTINGRGFIALAAVSFGRWRPVGVTFAAFLFGTAQAFSIIAVNFPALKALPTGYSISSYVITLIALVLFSGKNFAPRANGQPFIKEPLMTPHNRAAKGRLPSGFTPGDPNRAPGLLKTSLRSRKR